MKNYNSRGSILSLTAPADVLSGAGVVIGDLFCVATSDYATGEEGAFLVTGVVRLPKTTVGAFAPGNKVYWNATTGSITETDAGNTFAGYYLGAEGNLALVRLPL